MYKKLLVLLTAINVAVHCGDYHVPIPIRDILQNGRITSGTNAAAGQFPWQVAIEARKTGVIGFCGGSLITSNAVLTAGHCCKDYATFKIDLGSIYVDAPMVSRTATSSNVIFHPKYNSVNMNYDAAIIKLDQDVAFGVTIQPIQLPRFSHAVEDLFYDVALTVSGWGRTESEDIAKQLQYTNMTIIKNAECKLYFGSQGVVVESTICAKDLRNGKSSPCNGDSGGPALIFQNDNWMLIGIISFTSNGCASSFPAGFVNVSFLLSWISSTTGIPVANLM